MSDSTERETIINRIKTLFEHTVENGCTEAEAIEAALAAQRLIARYDVTDAELSERRDSEDIGYVYTAAVCTAWSANLASTVATAFRCRATVTRLGRGGSRKRYSFIGYQTDAEAARLAFEHLHEVGSRLATVEVRRWRREWPGYSLKGVKSSYCTGFVRGVADELERQTKALMVLVPEEVDAAYEAATTGGGTYAPRTQRRTGRLPRPLGRGSARNLRRVIAHSDVVCYNATNVVFTQWERTGHGQVRRRRRHPLPERQARLSGEHSQRGGAVGQRREPLVD